MIEFKKTDKGFGFGTSKDLGRDLEFPLRVAIGTHVAVFDERKPNFPTNSKNSQILQASRSQ